MASTLRLEDVLSDGEAQVLLNESYLDNGTDIPVIDGKVIPGVDNVEDVPVGIRLAQLKPDARKAPVARLRYYSDDDYMLRLTVPTAQRDIIESCLGMGATILDQTAINAANTVGDPTGVPTAVTDALFGVFAIDDNGSASYSNVDITIPRLPHADFPGAAKGTDHFFGAYDNATAVIDIDDSLGAATFNAVVTWTDRFIGEVAITGVDLSSKQTCITTYDPATALVTLAGVTRGVDYVDPNLSPGDECIILSMAYIYSQSGNANDWAITQPLTKPTRVVIDLFRAMGDSVAGPIWKRRRFYHCEQMSLPADSTSGDTTDPNKQVYEFVVRERDVRLGDQDKFYQTTYIVS